MLSRKKLRMAQQYFYLSFVIYLSAVVYLLFFSRMDTPISLWNMVGRLDPDSIPNVNLVPFGTILCYLSCLIPGNAYAQVALCNLFGNFLIFLPMGFYLPLLTRHSRSAGNFALRMFLVTFSVEFIQLLTGLGTFDVDDMILNMAGGLLGYFSCLLISSGTATAPLRNPSGGAFLCCVFFADLPALFFRLLYCRFSFAKPSNGRSMLFSWMRRFP